MSAIYWRPRSTSYCWLVIINWIRVQSNGNVWANVWANASIRRISIELSGPVALRHFPSKTGFLQPKIHCRFRHGDLNKGSSVCKWTGAPVKRVQKFWFFRGWRAAQARWKGVDGRGGDCTHHRKRGGWRAGWRGFGQYYTTRLFYEKLLICFFDSGKDVLLGKCRWTKTVSTKTTCEKSTL